MQADRLVGGADAVLVIDDTALPKKVFHSVGVAPQYTTSLRKNANCHTLVSVTLAHGEVPVVAARRDSPRRIANANSYITANLNGSYALTNDTSLQAVAYYQWLLQRVGNGKAAKDAPCDDGFVTFTSVPTNYGYRP